jgi:hypothetical protein
MESSNNTRSLRNNHAKPHWFSSGISFTAGGAGTFARKDIPLLNQ